MRDDDDDDDDNDNNNNKGTKLEVCPVTGHEDPERG
jgi:hypothetical protein